MASREGVMRSPYLGDETRLLLPTCSDNYSDSQNFDAGIELLTRASERTLPEAAMMMAPEAWEKNSVMRETERERAALVRSLLFPSPAFSFLLRSRLGWVWTTKSIRLTPSLLPQSRPRARSARVQLDVHGTMGRPRDARMD